MKARNMTVRTAALFALCLGAGFGLSGCTDNERYEAIKADPTPDLLTLAERPVDADNAWTVTRNENWRMFWRDLGKATYVDRPSRLTRETIPRP